MIEEMKYQRYVISDNVSDLSDQTVPWGLFLKSPVNFTHRFSPPNQSILFGKLVVLLRNFQNH